MAQILIEEWKNQGHKKYITRIWWERLSRCII